LKNEDTLGRISVVLVEPRMPGNVGSTARAMRNFGLSRLVLVNPVDIRSPEARRMAYGAEDLLEGARTVGSLMEAISGATLVVGTTHRRGRGREPIYGPRHVVERIISVAREGEVAILFGREDRGLTNEEIKLCDMVVSIPTACNYPSLNLSHAVMVIAYELFTASLGRLPSPPKLDLPTFEEREALSRRVYGMLLRIGFVPRDRSEIFLKSIRRVIFRTELERRDIATVHKVCSIIERRAAGRQKST